MPQTRPNSPRANAAVSLIEGLQHRFAAGLEALSGASLERVEWLRDGGRHGGGARYVAVETPVFNRAAVNFSCVHYGDEPGKRLASATALSTIIHPDHPRAPSVHMHFSYTELRGGGGGYWRLMADLNPAIPNADDRHAFDAALRDAAPEHYEAARAQGDRYFHIPALARHRGITHFYIEAHDSGRFEADAELARRVAEAGIDTYLEILRAALHREGPPAPEDRAAQLSYHTLYFLQVLTLDRGTTSGLLVHDQNDAGIMGSLPAYVDTALLRSWVHRLPPPQDQLLRELIHALPLGTPAHVTDAVRPLLAKVSRAHYKANPGALALQASGSVVPPTVTNHGIRRMRVGVLISGRGSNLRALLDTFADPGAPAEIALVVSNRKGAGGLLRAREAGVPTAVVPHGQYPDRAAFEEALHTTLLDAGVELVCLAGFMRVLTAGFVESWRDRLVNIHPSLLPKYPGLDTHARALAGEETEHGCTVHFVRTEVDAGPVIAQTRVPVLSEDTVDSLSARVLAEEHKLYPEVVRLIATGRVRVQGERALIDGVPLESLP